MRYVYMYFSDHINFFQTRILVTHSLAHLQECNVIIVMQDGKIVETGSYEELLENGGKLSEIIKLGDLSNGSSESCRKPFSNKICSFYNLFSTSQIGATLAIN